MKFKSLSLLRVFREKTKDEYPDLTYQQLKEVCFTPSVFFKKEIQKGELKSMRFTGLGSIRPYCEDTLMFRYHKLPSDERGIFERKFKSEGYTEEEIAIIKKTGYNPRKDEKKI